MHGGAWRITVRWSSSAGRRLKRPRPAASGQPALAAPFLLGAGGGGGRRIAAGGGRARGASFSSEPRYSKRREKGDSGPATSLRTSLRASLLLGDFDPPAARSEDAAAGGADAAPRRRDRAWGSGGGSGSGVNLSPAKEGQEGRSPPPLQPHLQPHRQPHWPRRSRSSSRSSGGGGGGGGGGSSLTQGTLVENLLGHRLADAWVIFHREVAAARVTPESCHLMLMACLTSEDMRRMIDVTMKNARQEPTVDTFNVLLSRLMGE